MKFKFLGVIGALLLAALAGGPSIVGARDRGCISQRTVNPATPAASLRISTGRVATSSPILVSTSPSPGRDVMATAR